MQPHLTARRIGLATRLSSYPPLLLQGKHTKIHPRPTAMMRTIFVILSPRAQREDASGLAILAFTQASALHGLMRTPNLLSDSKLISSHIEPFSEGTQTDMYCRCPREISNNTQGFESSKASSYTLLWSIPNLCTFLNTRLLRHVIVDKADLKLFVALLCQNSPDLSPLAVDLTEAPNLLCGPRVRDALHIHLDYRTIDTVLSPARFEELICIKVRKLNDSGRPLLVT